uniref:EF-hand domain-containing protein n=1 Tax=Trichobilharzia regenti TaxID=157069 RepID=A0AA85IS19_TRIRE|nr:unnamed protein product [Trichobilharzia regenti]
MSGKRTVYGSHSTWNPMTSIEEYCIVNDKRIQDYENIFMAAYVIGLESQLDRISASTASPTSIEYDTQRANRKQKDEETLVQQFHAYIHEQSINDTDHHLAIQNILEKIILFNNGQKSYPRGICHITKKLNDGDQFEGSQISTSSSSWSSSVSQLERISDLQSTNKKAVVSGGIQGKSVKSTDQLVDSFSKLTLNEYNQRCAMLDGMMKSLKDTFTQQRNTYQKYKDRLDNEDVSSENITQLDSKKPFPNGLREILGYKRYFQIIEKSNLLSVYNQMYVSRRLAKSTLKSYIQLQKEKIKLQLNWKHSAFSGTRIYRHNLWKYNIPEIMKSIQLDKNDLEYAFKKLNKHLEVDFMNVKVTEIVEAVSHWCIDINLFIVLASLAERYNGLESLVRNNIYKVGAQSLRAKIKKARELFALIGGFDSRQHCKQPSNNRSIFQSSTNQTQSHPTTTTDTFISSKKTKGKNNSAERKLTPFDEYIQVDDMKLFFYAGNIRQSHVERLIQYLDYQNTGKIDFITFLEYLPLFVECHKQILCKPLTTSEIFIS